jgi:peroxiredoxin
VNDQKFSIETDTVDFYNRMKITGSPDNIMFRDYQVFMSNAKNKLTELSSRSEKNKNNADSTAALKTQMTVVENQVKEYRKMLMDNHDPKLLLPAIIRALWEPDVPEAPKNPDGSKDAGFALKYFKTHFFDKLDFCDPRLIRTPLLHSKIMQYLSNLTYPNPDSIIISVDTIIERSKCNKEVFKYCLSELTNYYELSEVMGYDKIFVHLCEKYYLTDMAYWADSTLKSNIHLAVEKLKFNLIGVTGQNLLMQDTNGVTHALYDVKAKYTILAFYDPTCSHCKIEIPKLAQLYDSIKVNNIEVYAVAIESDLKEWKAFIREHNLNWINVYDMYDKTNYKFYYNIYMKPIIFLLDENKKIIAKRLDTDGLRNFLKHLLDEKKKNK